MMQTDISDVLNRLKSLSDSTDLIIYQHTRENELVDKWFSTIKETVKAIINSKNFPKSPGAEANECPLIPDLLSQIKGEKSQPKKNRVSSFLAAARKDHARLSHRKSRASLRKIVLEKKNGNLWEISQSKRSDDQKSTKSSDFNISPNVKDKVSKCSANASPSSKTSVNNKDKSNFSTPPPLQTEVLVPDSDDKTPVTRSKTRDIIILNPAATLKKVRPLSTGKKHYTQELTPDIIQKKTAKKNVTSDVQTLKPDGQSSAVSDQTDKIKSVCNSTPQYETIILDSDSGDSVESKPRTRSKRKSSIQLVQEISKKTKNSSSESQVIKQSKPRRQDSASGSKYSKPVRLNKNVRNAVIQPKASSTSQQVSTGSEKRILREIQKKEEVVSQNTKKLRNMRQMKIEESKKMRELKMEKAMQQRLKIESEKKEKMRCRTASKQENVQQKELSVKKTAVKKVQIEEKADSVKKVTPISSQKMNPPTTLKSLQDVKTVSGTPKKAPPKPVRTPVKKTKLSPVEQNTEQTATIMNQTFTNPPAEVLSASKDVFTKPSPLNTTYNAKPVNVTSTPTVNKTITKISKTPVSSLNKQNKSYTMTPSESSFVSYDVSEIKSDDSDEEESNNNKPIPSWASGVRLRNALVNQQYNPLDTAELFGNYFGSVDLSAIMGTEKKQYFKRTSSAIWINSPNRSLLY